MNRVVFEDTAIQIEQIRGRLVITHKFAGVRMSIDFSPCCITATVNEGSGPRCQIRSTDEEVTLRISK